MHQFFTRVQQFFTKMYTFRCLHSLAHLHISALHKMHVELKIVIYESDIHEKLVGVSAILLFPYQAISNFR